MKKVLKSRIFAFILGALIFSGITAVSAYTIFATDIGYTPSDSTWKKSNGGDITNVKDAIDDLYKVSKNKLPDSISIPLSTISYNTTTSSSTYTIRDFKNSYKYFRITNVSEDSNIKSCQFRAKINSENTDLIIDNDYEISVLDRFWVNVSGLSTNAANCSYILVLHNNMSTN